MRSKMLVILVSDRVHKAAIFHGYIQPDIILLDDALTVYKGSPWGGATDWKDFCESTVLQCL